MKQKQVPLVIGNWKMNPQSLAEAKDLFVTVRKNIGSVSNVDVLVAPPSIYISDLSRLSPSGRIGVVAQAVHPESVGPHTGEVSIPMMMSVGANHTLIGHSERRSSGISDEGVSSRLKSSWKEGMVPVVCIGEKVRDNTGEYFSVVEKQIKEAFITANKAQVKRTIIAYEPVWAIGTGLTATADDVYEMRLFIEKCLTKLYDRGVAQSVPILYGGSVNDKNVTTLYSSGNVDGFLVGGASLDANKFVKIIKIVSKNSSHE